MPHTRQACKTRIKTVELNLETISASDGDGMTLVEYRVLEVHNQQWREQLNKKNTDMLAAKVRVQFTKARKRETWCLF